MRDILDQISAANVSGYYYVALFSALTLPDICAALESPDGEARGERYIQWYDHNVKSGPATGRDIYQFRCSLLHQGRTIHPKSSFARIIFFEPESTTNIFHNCVFMDALVIDIRIFVSDIITAAANWLSVNETTEVFRTNYAAFVSRYPDGLSPYVKGVPIIG